MVKRTYTGEVYACKKCGYQWPQRPAITRSGDGLLITKIVLEEPKNCSKCKSIYWKTGFDQ